MSESGSEGEGGGARRESRREDKESRKSRKKERSERKPREKKGQLRNVHEFKNSFIEGLRRAGFDIFEKNCPISDALLLRQILLLVP